MAEYIEREALLERGFIHEMDNREYWTEEDILSAPAADVVEVVRCKDCKHYIKSMMLCQREDGLDTPDKMDFCSYGERVET